MLAAGIGSHITLVKGRTFANLATHPQGNYSKIPIISPGAYFLSKGLFEKNFLGGGGGRWAILGGGAYTRTIVIFFEIFCSVPAFITDFFTF